MRARTLLGADLLLATISGRRFRNGDGRPGRIIPLSMDTVRANAAVVTGPTDPMRSLLALAGIEAPAQGSGLDPSPRCSSEKRVPPLDSRTGGSGGGALRPRVMS